MSASGGCECHADDAFHEMLGFDFAGVHQTQDDGIGEEGAELFGEIERERRSAIAWGVQESDMAEPL